MTRRNTLTRRGLSNLAHHLRTARTQMDAFTPMLCGQALRSPVRRRTQTRVEALGPVHRRAVTDPHGRRFMADAARPCVFVGTYVPERWPSWNEENAGYACYLMARAIDLHRSGHGPQGAHAETRAWNFLRLVASKLDPTWEPAWPEG